MPPKKKTQAQPQQNQNGNNQLIPANANDDDARMERLKAFILAVVRENAHRSDTFETCVKLTAVVCVAALGVYVLSVMHSLAQPLVDVYVEEKRADGALRREMILNSPRNIVPPDNEGMSTTDLALYVAQSVAVTAFLKLSANGITRTFSTVWEKVMGTRAPQQAPQQQQQQQAPQQQSPQQQAPQQQQYVRRSGMFSSLFS